MLKKTILENGIRVITEYMPSVRSISMGVLVDVGPRNEVPGKSGLAHLAEHLMFQGTSSRGVAEIARMIDSAGGQMGAFTARDYTCYSATVLDDYSTYAIDLFGDILLNSIFPEEAVEREKGVIIREMCAEADMPDERVHSLLKEFVWQGHPLGRPIAGNPESVKQLSREDVIYFVFQNYLPDRIIVAAAGNVSHEDFVAQVRDAFWRMLGESPEEPVEPVPFQSGVVMETMQVSQSYFSLGIRAFPYSHPNRYAMFVLNNVLGAGLSSRLYRRMREERGLVYDIGSEYHAYRDDGILVVEGSTAPEYLIQVLGLTLAEMWKLIIGVEPVDDEELWKAGMQIRGQHLITSENTHTRMSRLATQELYFDRQIPENEILVEVRKTDAETLRKIAENGLTDALRNVAVAIVGPEVPEYYTNASIEDLLLDFQ